MYVCATCTVQHVCSPFSIFIFFPYLGFGWLNEFSPLHMSLSPPQQERQWQPKIAHGKINDENHNPIVRRGIFIFRWYVVHMYYNTAAALTYDTASSSSSSASASSQKLWLLLFHLTLDISSCIAISRARISYSLNFPYDVSLSVHPRPRNPPNNWLRSGSNPKKNLFFLLRFLFCISLFIES